MSDNVLKREYTTTGGKKITLVPISPYLLDEIKKGFEVHFKDEHGGLPEPPTYMADIGGVKVAHEHDLTSLDDDMYSEEEKEANHIAWNKYQELVALFSAGETGAISKAVMRHCVEFEYPENDDWAGRQRRDFVIVPEDEHDLRLHYVQTELVKSPTDIEEIVTTVLNLMGVSGEALQTVRDSFRGKVEGDINTAIGDSGEIPVGGE